MEVALGAEVGHSQSEDRQAIQLGQNVLLIGQQASQRVQLGVQPQSMALARVTLGVRIGRLWLQAVGTETAWSEP